MACTSFKQQIQQSQNFGINDHFSAIHANQEATAIIWERSSTGKQWHKLNPNDDAANLLADLRGKEDCYFTVNEFRGWRYVKTLRGLNALYVDIDDPNLPVIHAVTACREAMLPMPSLAVESGRGVHLYWLLEKAHGKALPLWQLVENRIIQQLKDVGVAADPAAKDCTRVLRLVGTINSKKGSKDVKGYYFNSYRWGLHEIADEILGERKPRPPRSKIKSKAEIRDIRARQSRVSGSIYARWHHVYTDLNTIADHYGKIPDGFRNNWVFLAATALSWFTHAESLENEIKYNLEQYTTLSHAEVASCVQTVLERAGKASRGVMLDWNGKKVDSRYRFKRSTIYDWCEKWIDDDLLLKLRAIIPDELADERRKEAWAGRYKHAQAAAKTEGMALLAKGCKVADVARKTGTSIRTVQRWNKLLKQQFS